MKKILYVIYALIFYFYSIIPLNKNKTTFIMTHDNSINGNIMCMYRKVKEEQPNHICKFITKSQLKRGNILNKFYDAVKFIIVTPYYLATSKNIFLDNVFLPMAYIKFKSQVNVVQLWHGCNTLKKFGQLSNTGTLKKLEKRANSTYTHVIVSSKKMIQLHKQAFGVDEKIIHPLGLPRMDVFFCVEKMEEEKNKFYSEFEWLRNKKVILYAPTFRDNQLTTLDNYMDLSEVADQLPDEFVIINKFHPFVSNQFRDIKSKRILDLSYYKDLTRLLLISDILISDYSSIIFDYALLNKRILFYAYDKDEYERNIRGFYYDYEEYIENKIVKSKPELIEKIINIQDIYNNRVNFINKYIDYLDNNAVDRIYNLIYGLN